MTVKEYRDTDGLRKWELLYEGIYLVLLNKNAPEPFNSQLLAFEGYGPLIWALSPASEQDQDYIVNIWFNKGELYAGSFSGYQHKLNCKTGEVLETRFTK